MRRLALVAVLVLAGCGGPYQVDLADVPPAPPAPPTLPGASTGTFTWDCGRNAEGHRNADNMIASPGERGAAHHVHDYVGNLSTDATSTDASLAGAATTCGNGDLSTYYWPVLRTGEPHHGPIRSPTSVRLVYHGNPTSPVLPLPRFTRASTGDAKGGPLVRASWTCEGRTDRLTTKYPNCAKETIRVYDFPSCWDGRRTDSPNHRDHLVFPAANGACPPSTFAVPRLRLTVSYDLRGAEYSIDTFPQLKGDPRTDHADLVTVMPDPLTATVVSCLNAGRNC
ncbi:DUF1996 domain-containing protein [Longispora urticae]